MTHTLILEPETERALQVKAQRRGLDVDAFLTELARREAQAPDEYDEARRAHFLALCQQLTPIIENGTIAPLGSLDAAALIEEIREERDAEIEAALKGDVR